MIRLRKWVEQQMSQMDNSNRHEATEEMKKVIHQHTVAGDLWTFDWTSFKLQTYGIPAADVPYTNRDFIQP